MELTMERANRYLKEADGGETTQWVGHSRSAGMAAFLLAKNIPGMNAEMAGSYGFLHDIGRAFGDETMKIDHIFQGYRFLLSEGYPEAARICLTHSFPVQDIKSVTGVWDCTEEDYNFLEHYLQSIEYTPYDRLIQFCDNISLSEGIVLLERRLVDIVLRYGLDAENLLPRWKSLFAIKEELETAMGCSVEEALGLIDIRRISEDCFEKLSMENRSETMDADVEASKFPPILCEALQEGKIKFPDSICNTYAPICVYRGVVTNNKKRKLEQSDFFSQIERNLPGYSMEDIKNYSCSVFSDKKSLELAFKLPRKGKMIAKGTLIPMHDPCIFENEKNHIHWFRFRSSHPEQFFEVLENEPS